MVRDLRKLHGERGVMGAAKRDGLYFAFVVALCDQDDRYAANIFDGEQSAREWWQSDHILTGFALTELEPESHWDALASAQRGELQRHQLCVWLDRGSYPDFRPRYRIFRRAPRIAPSYRPTEPELIPAAFAALIGQ